MSEEKTNKELSPDELKDVAGGAPHYSDYSGSKFKAGSDLSKAVNIRGRGGPKTEMQDLEKQAELGDYSDPVSN